MKTGTERKQFKKGSLSIEAALVLPIFLFAMICLISLSALLLFQMKLKEAMHEEVKVCAMKSVSDGIPGTDEMEADILEMIGEYTLKIAPIEGEISFSSYENSEEIVSISAEYTSGLYYDFGGLFHHTFVQKCLQHDFRGYEEGLYSINRDSEDEQYVYITEDSEVYHLNRECSHIKLDISEVSADEIKDLRNSGGSKYKSCEHCRSKLTDGTLYITTDGEKYHNSLSCSGLKRSVRAVPLSEVSGRRCCSRCGG